MLEEALNSDRFPPPETARAVLNFLRYELPSGGAAAEARFLNLFPLLCSRIFGPLDENHLHQFGGWLSRQNRWSGAGSSQSESSNTSEVDVVIQLLRGSAKVSVNRLTLIDAMSEETVKRPEATFALNFSVLPNPTRQAIIEKFGGSIIFDNFGRDKHAHVDDNAIQLFETLLQIPVREQRDLQAFFQREQIRQNHERRSPSSNSPLPTPPSESKSPNIMLTILEFYLVLFLRYPLAPFSKGKAGEKNVPAGVRPQPHYLPSRKSYGDEVYMELFRSYLPHFLPHAQATTQFLGFSSLSHDSELFLRIAFEFWMEGENHTPSVSQGVERLQQRRHKLTKPLNLDSSYDLAEMLGPSQFVSCPTRVQTCIRHLINWVISDPGMALSMKATRARVPDGPSRNQWCLGPAMTVCQQSFYKYILTTLRHAPLHVPNSQFFTALNAWLVWLEPWNVEQRMWRPNLDEPKVKEYLAMVFLTGKPRSEMEPFVTIPWATTRSYYSLQWEPYIAANLHFYTVPLAIFLHRARELDLSPQEFYSSVKHVQRVFRVFSPMVVKSIERFSTSERYMHPLADIVSKHEQLLGQFSPSNIGAPLTLSACQQDMVSLLEEIRVQHNNSLRDMDFFDRFAQRIDNVIGEVSLGEIFAIDRLIAKGKVIVNLPKDYNVLPNGYGRGPNSGRASSQPERINGVLLTETGREQVLAGAVKCSSLDVAYLGDPMTSRVRSYEIALLVPVLVHLSMWINQLLSFGGKKGAGDDVNSTGVVARRSWFRVNLRFLADKRNLIFFFFVWWVFRL